MKTLQEAIEQNRKRQEEKRNVKVTCIECGERVKLYGDFPAHLEQVHGYRDAI